MASISGSQFSAYAERLPVGHQDVVPVYVTTLPPPAVSGEFNLEVYTGSTPPTSLAPGYQGLAILSTGPSGKEIQLETGAFGITDNGNGNDTLIAYGNHETITGGSGSDQIGAYGNSDSIVGGSGPDTITVGGLHDTIDANSDSIHGMGGSDFYVAGSSDYISLDPDAAATIVGANDTVALDGADSVKTTGNSDLVAMTGQDTVIVSGANDTVYNTPGAAMGSDVVSLTGSAVGVPTTTDFTFKDSGDPNATYNDTIIGFNASNGDTIQLNGGDTAAYALGHSEVKTVDGVASTVITLNDGSTITLKGVTNINGNFFS